MVLEKRGELGKKMRTTDNYSHKLAGELHRLRKTRHTLSMTTLTLLLHRPHQSA